MRLDVITIFPDYLAPLDLSLIGRARRDGLIDLAVHDLRAFTHDRHRTVDDTPYGGGAGMVMKPEPWGQALDHVAGLRPGRPTLVVPGPGGRPFTQPVARELVALPWLVFACGRYEGIDERVYEHAARDYDVRVLSLGDYVLNGGEVAVLAMVEAVARLLPGVVGNAASLVEESHEDGLLEYPVYTKPAVWEGRAVPEVLLSGDHARIADWRHRQRLERTAARRPDLLPPSGALHPAGLAAAHLTSATPADAGELLTLAHAGLGPDHPALPADAAEVVASLASWDTRVLRSGGRLVGAVRGRVEGSQWQVDGPLVVPDLRGRGLGAWLLGQALARAPGEAEHAVAVVPDDRAGWPGYRRAGLRPHGTAPAGATRLSGRLRRG